MTKKDLKTGMILEFRNGYKTRVLLGTADGDIHSGDKVWDYLDNFHDNLISKISTDYDIIRVFKIVHNKQYAEFLKDIYSINLTKLWEREEFKYPMWFKSFKGDIVKFTGLNIGTVVASGKHNLYDVGHSSTNWVSHTYTTIWTQVEAPIEEMTIEEICKALGKTVKIVRDK